MPLYDYKCACGVFEEFRSIENRLDSKTCFGCSEPIVLVLIKAPGISLGDGYRDKMKSIGARPYEPGVFKDCDNQVSYRTNAQRKKMKSIAEDTVRDLGV